jgi:hypothetical protein
MASDIQTLVAEYTRDILLTLAQPARQHSVRPRAARLVPAPEAAPRAGDSATVLNHEGAELLDSGSWFLPSRSRGAESGWSIFVMADQKREAGLSPFFRRGAISASLAPVQLVGAAYRAILNRTVDSDGEAVYSALLSNGALAAPDLFRILVSSDEARGRRERLLIVPASQMPPRGPGEDEPGTVYFAT